MNTKYLSKLISELIGLPLWKISIGLSGLSIQLGKKVKGNLWNQQIIEGEISLWVQCNTRILQTSREGDKEILFSYYPQEEEEENIYKEHFEGRNIIDAFIQEKDQSLHLKFDSNVKFIAYPWTKESEKCWSIYDHRIQNPPGILIYKDGIEIVE